MGNANGGTQFSKYYKVGKHIGSGTFATVKRCIRRSDKKQFAVKIINKTQLTSSELDQLKDEINILASIRSHNHPHIINLIDVFESKRKVKLVLELCRDENLLDNIYSSPNRRLDESKCAHIIHKIAETIKYLHDNKVVHRDLKPENILFANDGTLKICDFGSAHKSKNDIAYNIKMKSNVGTPLYVAPEILSNGTYSHMVDLWSIGVILYLCLCGYHPFSCRKSLDKMYKSIIKGSYKFSSPLWDNIDNDAVDLVRQLLCVDANKRITCDQLMKHKWILKHVNVEK